jgi:hypothetical protein
MVRRNVDAAPGFVALTPWRLVSTAMHMLDHLPGILDALWRTSNQLIALYAYKFMAMNDI